MITRILCPIDFSEPSRLALRYAALFARWYRAPITVLHVSDDWLSTSHAEVIERVREFASPILLEPIAVDYDSRLGSPAAEIATAAERIEADLLVLATHGSTGFDRLVMVR